MNALNQVILEGNVVRQPEKKALPSGSCVCSIPIAVNYRYKTSAGEPAEEVSYFDVETFGNLADACSKWCPKGRGLRVVGRLRQNRWKDKEGRGHSAVRIVAEHVDFKRFPRAAEEASPAERPPLALTKEQKLAMLAEAAGAARAEQEAAVF